MVSGYLFYHLRYEKGRYQKFLPFLIGKWKRLLVPYLFVTIVWVAPITTVMMNLSIQDVVEKYVLGLGAGQLWFLLMLFHVFILFYVLGDFFEKHLIYGVGVVVLLYVVGKIGGLFVPNFFQLRSALSYAPVFWVGFQIRKHHDFVMNWSPRALFIVDVGLFALTQYISLQDSE